MAAIPGEARGHNVGGCGWSEVWGARLGADRVKRSLRSDEERLVEGSAKGC